MEMNRYLFFLLAGMFLSACSENKLTGTFELLPSPQKFTIEGVSDLEPQDINSYNAIEELDFLLPDMVMKDEGDAVVVFKLDSLQDVRAEGYTLSIEGGRVAITGKDRAGLLYGFQTLRQLMEDAEEQEVFLPECTITDYPLLSYRPIHLDVKHHREKLDYYYKLMDKLAFYKINAVIVELEDKIRYEKRPLIGSGDALTIEEWKDLSSYALKKNIRMSPLVQGLGHASFVLKHPEYFDLRDDPDSDWAFNPLDSGTYRLQFDLYEDALDALPHGRYLHVGGDEVHTTGRNSGKSSLELQLLWLNKVTDFAERYGRIPIVWDDMPLKQVNLYYPTYQSDVPEEEVDSLWKENGPKLEAFLDDFPRNCVYMRWNYMAPQTPGNKRVMKWYEENGLKAIGATAGQTRWVLMPQNESNIDNIKSFAVSSIASNLGGLLLTLWDDDSPHFELYSRGILAFAEYSWAGNSRDKEKFKSVYRYREFSNAGADSMYAFIDDLEKPVAFWKNALLEGNQRNYLKRMEDPMSEAVIEIPDIQTPGKWNEKYSKRVEEAQKMLSIGRTVARRISQLDSVAIRNHYALQIYEQVNALTSFASRALIRMSEADAVKDPEQRREAFDELLSLAQEFKDIRQKFESVYAQTRILNKPDNYILDSDHHVHLANQSINFDWQFLAEMLFLEKLEDRI